MQRTFGYVAIGLGVVAGGAGAYFRLQRSSKLDDRDSICPAGVNCTVDDAARINALTDEAKSASTAGSVAFGVGGALVIAGVVLWLTAPQSMPNRSATTTTPGRRWFVAPSVSHWGGGVMASGSF